MKVIVESIQYDNNHGDTNDRKDECQKMAMNAVNQNIKMQLLLD